MSTCFENGDANVKALQLALQKAGFPPGTIDGEFGIGTKAALQAFQRSSQLLPDGIPGPLSRAALGLESAGRRPDASEFFTVQIVGHMFPGAALSNIAKHLPLVVKAMTGMTDRVMLLMALSTIRAESAGFVPIKEGISRFNTSPLGHPFDLYDNRRDLGNRGRPDGDDFAGAGFVQLTGRRNFDTYGRRLGVDLIAAPQLACDPAIASAILAQFLRDREQQIRNALFEGDLRAARRLVNGGTHGLDAFTDAYRIGESLTIGLAV